MSSWRIAIIRLDFPTEPIGYFLRFREEDGYPLKVWEKKAARIFREPDKTIMDCILSQRSEYGKKNLDIKWLFDPQTV